MYPLSDVKMPIVAPAGLPLRLRNGTHILLRPILPTDRASLHRGMAALSARARRHRFFTAKGDLAEDLVTYLTEIDYQSHFAWVAVDLDRAGQPVVAVGRYVTLVGAVAEDALAGVKADPTAGPAPAGGPKVAEIAFVVGDDYQRQGLATVLLDLLSVVAADNGITHFYAFVLDDNLAMRRLLAKAGAKFRLDEAGVLRTIMMRPATSGRFCPDDVVAISRSAARASTAAPLS